MKRSLIDWTDYSSDPLTFVRRGKRGDCECSPACAHCYALRIGERFDYLPDHTTMYPDKLEKLARMKFPQYGNRRGPGSKPMAFVCDTGDLFHERVSDDFIYRAFGIMAEQDDVTWQVLTKRAERMKHLLQWARGDYVSLQKGGPVRLGPVPNIWLGVTICNQEEADRNIPLLLETPAAVRFLSIEPMLGPIDLRFLRAKNGALINCLYGDVMTSGGEVYAAAPAAIDWVIVGGESGPDARPMHPDWVRSIRDQCVAANIPLFMKQWGEWAEWDGFAYTEYAWSKVGAGTHARLWQWDDGTKMERVGRKVAGHLLDGVEYREFPK